MQLNGYSYLDEDILLEYRTKKSPLDKSSSYPVDIAVLKDGKPFIFIEVKKESSTSKKGIEQLKNYMSLNDNVVWGVWTNGREIVYIKKAVKKSIEYLEVFDIPKKVLIVSRSK